MITGSLHGLFSFPCFFIPLYPHRKSEAIPIRQNAITTAEISGRKRAIMDEELTDKRATTSKKGLTLCVSLTE